MASTKSQRPTWIKPQYRPQHNHLDVNANENSLSQIDGLFVYNSLTKSKVPFTPINGKRVTWYSCGPTVYDASHIGHARNYVSNDIIRRVMEEYFGYNIHFVMNITDIDDKIILRARQNELIRRYREQHLNLTPTLKSHVEDAWKQYVLKKLVPIVGNSAIQGIQDFGSLDPLSEAFETYKTKDEKFSMYYTSAKTTLEALKGATTAEELITSAIDPLSEWLDDQFKTTVTDPKIFLEFTRHWEKSFMDDMQKLNVLPPHTLTRVSEYIPEIISYIQVIIKNGCAYELDGSIYFDTSSFSKTNSYAKLVPSAASDLKLISEGEGSLASKTIKKKSEADFALWKSSKPGEPSWDSPWGKGRPGWHIECSVMASDVLGSPIDIHSGGIDLAFPHHDNELAQAEAYHGCGQWINYFLHMGHLHIQGQKMSKSLKNFITIKEALKEYSARELRIAFLMCPWTSTVDFKTDLIKHVKSIELQISNFFTNAKAIIAEEKENNSVTDTDLPRHKYQIAEKELIQHLYTTQDAVHEAMCDSIDTPNVMNRILDLISQTNIYFQKRPNNADVILQITEYVTFILRVFGLSDQKIGWSLGEFYGSGSSTEEDLVMPYLRVLAAFRDGVRKMAIEKSTTSDILALCDRLRDIDLVNLGVSLDDREDGKALIKLVPKEELKKIREEKLVREAEKQRKKLLAALEIEKKQLEKIEKAKLNPKEMFTLRKNEYKLFDEDGIPTHLADGQEVPKSRRKKLIKEYETQKKLHEQWLNGLL